ncbi:hypothetical protein ACZ90_25795 [Streptomyces albus subsp. albus]|nr:hypothetical protein ACZ90_25795 [Streptomyces albus subsp. albus]
MAEYEAFELVFAKADQPGEPAEDVLIVHRTDRKGPGGHPVYSDETGIVQAEITDRGEVRMVASGGHQTHAAPLRVRPVGGPGPVPG